MGNCDKKLKVPEGWKRVKLGEVAENKKFAIVDGPFGTQLHSEEYVKEGVPLVRITNLSFEGKFIEDELMYITEKKAEFLKRSRVIPGDIIIAKTGATIGKSGIFPEKFSDGIIASSCLKISLDILKANEKFILYFIVSHKGQNAILNSALGTTRTTININPFANITLLLPPLPEQQRIADILETVDNAIEKTDQIIEKYKRIKQGLMQDLLTKGVTVNGDSGGDGGGDGGGDSGGDGESESHRNQSPSLSYRLRDEKRDKFKDSPLGRIPEEWEVVKLGEVSLLKGRIGWHGLTTQEYLEDGEYYLIAGINFKCGKIDWDSCVYVSKKRYEFDKNIQIKDNDILVTKDGTIGKIAYISRLPKPATLGTGVFVLRLIENVCFSKYKYFALTSFIFDKFIENLRAGSTINHLYQKDFVNFRIPLPPLPEQQRIASILSQIDEAIEKETAYKEKLKRLKLGLMEDLLTGKVRVNSGDSGSDSDKKHGVSGCYE